MDRRWARRVRICVYRLEKEKWERRVRGMYNHVSAHFIFGGRGQKSDVVLLCDAGIQRVGVRAAKLKRGGSIQASFLLTKPIWKMALLLLLLLLKLKTVLAPRLPLRWILAAAPDPLPRQPICRRWPSGRSSCCASRRTPIVSCRPRPMPKTPLPP